MSLKNPNLKICAKEKFSNFSKGNDEAIKTTAEKLKLKTITEKEKEKEKVKVKEQGGKRIETKENNPSEKNLLFQKEKTNITGNRKDTAQKDRRLNQLSENKKHYLYDVDKTIMKKSQNCVNYAYKNLTQPKNQINDVKILTENNKALDILSLEKKKKKKKTVTVTVTSNKESEIDKETDDTYIHKLIYDTFINKNLKIPTNKLSDVSDAKKKKRITKKDTSAEKTTIKETKVKDKIKIQDMHNQFECYRKNVFQSVQNNLTAPETEKDYAESSTQVITKRGNYKENEEKQKENRKNKISVSTQVNFKYDDDLKCVSKIISKKILNEAFIQISYEENLKQLDEKKRHIQNNDELNKTVFKKLVDAQQNNLDLIKEQKEIMSILNICNKIQLFVKSRGMIEFLLKENVPIARETEIFDRTEKMKWQNEVVNTLAKYTTALLRTEKMASFAAEELCEETAINLCMRRNNETVKLKDFINFQKNFFHAQRKINKGHLSLLLNIENVSRRVSVKVEEHMLLRDVLRKIKMFIKKELPLLKDKYDLNFLKIRGKEAFVTSVKELLMAEPGELTICLVQKLHEKKNLKK